MPRVTYFSRALLGAVLVSAAGCGLLGQPAATPPPAGDGSSQTPSRLTDDELAGLGRTSQHLMALEPGDTGTGTHGNAQRGQVAFDTSVDDLNLTLRDESGRKVDVTSNGRSCRTCHVSGDLFSLTATNVKSRPGTDALLKDVMADADPDVGQPGGPKQAALKAQMLDKLREHALVRIVHNNPHFDPRPHRANAADNPRYIRLWRAVPTVVNVALGPEEEFHRFTFNPGQPAVALALPDLVGFTMFDMREPSLEHQAGSAALGHAQSRYMPSSPNESFDPDHLRAALQPTSDDIAAFQRERLTQPASLLTTDYERPDEDERFGDDPEPIENMPLMPRIGQQNDDPLTVDKFAPFDYAEIKKEFMPDLAEASFTAGQERGFKLFVGTPQKPGCIVCHNMPGTLAGGTELREDAGVSERNVLKLPLQRLRLWDEENLKFVTVMTPDPGLAAITGNLDDLEKFKIPQLRGIKSLGRFFHDNNATTLDGMVDHYGEVFPELFTLTPEEKGDLKTFLQML